MTARQKKLYKKRFLKTLVLMLALILTIGGLQRYVLCGNNQNGIRLRAFYKEDPGSLDVVLLGASEVYSGFGAGEFYKMTGVTSYPYTFESNPVTLWKYQLDEILRRQTPKVLIVELNGIVYDDDMLYKEASVRYMSDNMRSLPEKWEMVRKYGTEELPSYFFPIMKYHSRWNLPENLKRAKVLIGMDLRGYSYLKGFFTHTARKELPEEWTDFDPEAKRELNEHAEEALREFLDACDASGIEHVLFVRFPHLVTDNGSVSALERYNRAVEIVTERGYEFLNLDKCREECGIRSEEDYYDKEHLILSGQKKLTDFLAGYLMEKYDLEPTELTPKQKEEWEQCVKMSDACYVYYDEYMKDPTEDKTYEICERKDILDILADYM